MTPDIAFEKGFTPKGSHNDLVLHTTSNRTAGNFISTSPSDDIALGFAGKNGYVYEIRTTNYIDVNKTLGVNAVHPGQFEFSIPGGVLPSEIRGAWVVKGGSFTGEY